MSAHPVHPTPPLPVISLLPPQIHLPVPLSLPLAQLNQVMQSLPPRSLALHTPRIPLLTASLPPSTTAKLSSWQRCPAQTLLHQLLSLLPPPHPSWTRVHLGSPTYRIRSWSQPLSLSEVQLSPSCSRTRIESLRPRAYRVGTILTVKRSNLAYRLLRLQWRVHLDPRLNLLPNRQ